MLSFGRNQKSLKMKELVETLCDINEVANELIEEDYPSLSTERKLVCAIALVQANALQNIAEAVKYGLVIEKGQPSALEAIAMQMGFTPKQ